MMLEIVVAGIVVIVVVFGIVMAADIVMVL